MRRVIGTMQIKGKTRDVLVYDESQVQSGPFKGFVRVQWVNEDGLRQTSFMRKDPKNLLNTKKKTDKS